MTNLHATMQITADFKSELEREYEHLRSSVRPMIAERLQSAREGGDITDNAAFEQAKEDLARLMGRMAEIEQTLREAVLLDGNGHKRKKTVELGSIVTVAKPDGRSTTYTIVSSLEASPNDGKISNDSPVGRALVGRKRGDSVTVQAPAGPSKITITDIQHM
ncbi:MAG: GreA/GreB family elongation factor [Chloroflexota bacterium]